VGSTQPWSQYGAPLTPSDATSDQKFGSAVALSGTQPEVGQQGSVVVFPDLRSLRGVIAEMCPRAPGGPLNRPVPILLQSNKEWA
jgi:hypothetical protein